MWSDLSPFTQGYIEALFASELPDGAQLRGNHIPLGFSDLAPETLARIIADCEAQGAHYNQPNDAKRHAHLGRDFWLDGQRAALCFKNHDGSPRFPPLTVQLGDDGKVRFV